MLEERTEDVCHCTKESFKVRFRATLCPTVKQVLGVLQALSKLGAERILLVLPDFLHSVLC